jgi:hypothetical protein
MASGSHQAVTTLSRWLSGRFEHHPLCDATSRRVLPRAAAQATTGLGSRREVRLEVEQISLEDDTKVILAGDARRPLMLHDWVS